MVKVVTNVMNQVLNLNIFEGHRTTVMGACIILLNIFQGNAATIFHMAPLSDPVYFTLMGLFTERALKFSKDHKLK